MSQKKAIKFMHNKIILTIGNLSFTKKAIMIAIIGFFLSGTIFGFLIYNSIQSQNNFPIFLSILLNGFIWLLTFKSLQKEIVANNL